MEYGAALEAAATGGSGAWKLPLALAMVSGLASIVAAVIAARSARGAKRAEIDAQHIRDLESRIAEKKYETYRPMINLFRDILDRHHPEEQELRERISEFSNWVSIFGSDDAVKAFHNFMQAAYADPPPAILMRLYADFVIAARRDLGYPNTGINRKHFLGMRINDIYEHPLLQGVDEPFDELCREHGWHAPWRQM
ncbi:hypothetical protein [Streptomyces netropsis]|uniref:Uncharacterized protein n=1 Tax=Streptomyces netropsis TaxID=55404 RepID=A0A7W7L7S5_STRNE|nr:hypothetical protein [Streptomyces netropsis]MBB4884638.1 hypothetical protein [Streptomyces netropsis]GGR02280.1 hypothetical protein GCM10010219_02710 [Streptomyces netropsis]